jgi:hypothetical protein
MTTIAPLLIDADRETSAAWHRSLLAATKAFVAADCPAEAADFADDVMDDDGYWTELKRADIVGWSLRRYWPGSKEAEALAAAWESGERWYDRDRADFLAANPREALLDAMKRLSKLVLHARWSDNTPFAVWQVAVLDQPPAVFHGPLTKANGHWLYRNPDAPESRELVAKVRRLHEATGGWWWNPDVDADPTFLPTAQWEQVYARTLHDPDRSMAVVSIRADGSRKVYRGREGVDQWLDDNPEIVEAMRGNIRP